MQSTITYRQTAGADQTPPLPQRRRARWSWVGLPLAAVIVLLVWQGVASAGDYAAFILPSPWLVAQRLAQELTAGYATGSLLWHTWATLVAALGGFGLALVVSLVLGYVLSKTPLLERALTPLLAATQAVPVVAVAPLIILWVGADGRAKLLVAALVTFFPILSSTIIALRTVPRELREMAQISGANRRQLLWNVELPLALPVLFGGVKAGLALATTGAVVGEFVAGRAGLGALINIARGLFDTPLIFVALLALAALTLAFYAAASTLERALVRWEA
ncbi:MAG: ABC transporter permease [Chloroflexales bacterium]|nr:ABC transporter permease [Chloroflexales bacterium]